jgi:selenocysteine lyase/cysteine desulfurase
LAVAAESVVTAARQTVAKFFGLSDASRCIFTFNCTDALNLAFKSLLKPGDHVITSVLEHNSVSRPLNHLAEQGGVTVTRVGATADGAWRVEDVWAALMPQTRLIALTHCSNVLGVVCPAEELAERLRQTTFPGRKPLFLADAAQTAGVIPLDLETLGLDLVAVPGHKGLFGPTGTGALLLGSKINVGELTEWREGGTGGDSASPRQPRELPHFLEGGTPNVVGLAGMLAGVRFLEKQSPHAVLSHERRLVGRLIEGLLGDERFSIKGTTNVECKVGVLSLTIRDRDAAEVAAILDQAFNVAVRPGLHCAPYAHKALGTFSGGTVRLSPGFFNTEEEVETVLTALREIAA